MLPIAFVFVSYLQHQKDLSDKALALGVVKDPKVGGRSPFADAVVHIALASRTPSAAPPPPRGIRHVVGPPVFRSLSLSATKFSSLANGFTRSPKGTHATEVTYPTAALEGTS